MTGSARPPPPATGSSPVYGRWQRAVHLTSLIQALLGGFLPGWAGAVLALTATVWSFLFTAGYVRCAVRELLCLLSGSGIRVSTPSYPRLIRAPACPQSGLEGP